MGEFEVLKARKVGKDRYIILCKLDNDVTPWATWCSNTINGDERYWGHYFYEGEEQAAYNDFENR